MLSKRTVPASPMNSNNNNGGGGNRRDRFDYSINVVLNYKEVCNTVHKIDAMRK